MFVPVPQKFHLSLLLHAHQPIGDDQIQRRTQGVVVPESFTHGSAEQRARWFKTGLESGDVRDCNTFAAR